MIYILCLILLFIVVKITKTSIFKSFMFKINNGLKDDGFLSYTFLYNEIFIKEEYNVIKIIDGMTIVDVGANIGLFNLYLNQKAKNLNIYSFEPVPQIFECLKHNLTLTDQCNNNIIVNKGLGKVSKTTAINYLKQVSAMSSMCEFDKIKKDAHNYIYPKKAGIFKGVLKYFLEKQMNNPVVIQTKITTLSEVINKHNIEKIDLIKIDVEGYELEVLEGIEENHFKIIQNLVIEIEHFRENRTEKIVKILRKHKFTIKTLKGTGNWRVLFANKIKHINN